MTNDALKKQGMTVEKRESLPLGSGNAILAIVRQDTSVGRIRKWLLIAPIDNLTALVSLEMPRHGAGALHRRCHPRIADKPRPRGRTYRPRSS